MDPLSKSTDAANTGLNFAMTCQELHRNMIRELPPELLTNIFSWASGLSGRYHMDTRSSEPYVPRLQIMARVCRTWREIIEGTPALWAFITDQDKASAIMALNRSQSHPIGLSFGDKRIDEALYTKVLNHSHRWIRASIQVRRRDEEKALQRLEEVNMPILQHLALGIPAWDRRPFVLDLFRDHPPQLTSLTLIKVAMRRWDAPVFGPRLRELKLMRIHTSGPTRENLHSILYACPELAHLELETVALSNETNELLPRRPPVQLPLLRTLVLKQLSPADAIDVLRMAETPYCNSCTISIESENMDSMMFSRVVEQIQQPFKACINSCRILEIHLHNSTIHIICRNDRSPSSDFDLKLGWGDSNEKVLDWLDNMFLVRRPPLSPLPIHPEFTDSDSSSSSPFNLLQLPDVRSLTITDLHGWTNHLAEALSTPRNSENGCAVWMWPSLREVTIGPFKGSSEALLHMFETRGEAASHPPGTEGIGTIAMLERVEVREKVFTLEEIETIRAVVRDVVISTPPGQHQSFQSTRHFFGYLLAPHQTWSQEGPI
ncbi:hypothetical protein FRB94_003152 [Tulasnella sp. JGI-2019a]|nr:hypothetical protein FRB93_005208 [Tulasnella sp. JGI-2019a]KAG9003384.1 hypothetical protein FRB94_003152 [Tulasnella sp. JGI-2019a]KAG9029815.1 hypothetical protein FRB95_004867 [Tulasnella sp. JGI-2019a]